MDRKSICFVAVVLLLALATTSYGIVIGDFEQWMDDWVETWQTEATFSYSTIGATRGAYSLAIKPNKTGYQWVVMNNGLMDLDSYPILSADVTWIAAEWGSTRWVNLKDVAVNSAAGWFQVIPEDPVSPDWPGDWNPVGCGDHTRTLTWDLSGLDMSLVTDWMQILFSINMDPGATIGTYYIDNVQLIPEPMTVSLLGLGGLTLLRRKR